VNYLTKSILAIGQVVGLILGDGYVAPYESAMQSDSNTHFIW
jgi:hypothetical protein